MSDLTQEELIKNLLNRIKILEEKTNVVEDMKQQISDLHSIAGLTDSDLLRQEVLKEAEFLKKNDIEIQYVNDKLKALGIKRPVGRLSRPLLESEILKAQQKSKSAAETARNLNVSLPTYKKYAVMYGIYKAKDPKEKRGNKSPTNPHKGKFPIQALLECKHPNFPIHRLKDKLIRAGIKKAECEQCGFSERRITDGKIPLLLNFEDNDSKNHKLENIKVYCYNCTFLCGRGFISRGKENYNLDPDMLQGAKFPIKARF